MKGKISIVLLLILLISGSGITVDSHFCNGKLADVFLLPHFGDCCDSSMPMDDDSCGDEILNYWPVGQVEYTPAKIDIDKSFYWLDEAITSLLERVYYIKNDNRIILTSSYSKANIKIYLRNEVFLN